MTLCTLFFPHQLNWLVVMDFFFTVIMHTVISLKYLIDCAVPKGNCRSGAGCILNSWRKDELCFHLTSSLSTGIPKCMYTHEAWIGFHCGMAFKVFISISDNFCFMVMEPVCRSLGVFLGGMCLLIWFFTGLRKKTKPDYAERRYFGPVCHKTK